MNREPSGRHIPKSRKSHLSSAFTAFAVAAPGLEPIIADELNALGVDATQVVEGGVEFRASSGTLFRANLHLRTASRVLIRLARFRALSFAELERSAKRIPWETVIGEGGRVLLRVTCRKSRLYHSGAVAERLMRDLVERMGAQAAAVPRGVAEDEPGNAQLIVVRIDHDRCTISADSSGAHLHQRGYRTAVTPAPIRETLAAALVLASGWDRTSALIDPFCGSGTIPIEAALLAANIAPGIQRDFRFMEWPGYDAEEWRRLLQSARKREVRHAFPLVTGADRSAAAIRAARDNAARAGVDSVVQFAHQDVAKAMSPTDSPGWIVSNPPYGVRLGDATETHELMSRFGEILRTRFQGWHLAIVAQANPARAMNLALEDRLRTTNGGLRVVVTTGIVPGVSRSPRAAP